MSAIYDRLEKLAVSGDWENFLTTAKKERDLDKILSPTGDTPLLLAIRYGAAEVAFQLIELGINPNVVNGSGEHPLYLACNTSELTDQLDALADRLLKRGLDVNLRGYADWTALHSAAATNNVRLAELLLANGADIDGKADCEQATPLDLAVRFANEEVAVLLSSRR